ELEVPYILGSGSHSVAYLGVRDGYVFQSVMEWFSAEKRWGLSPGFEEKNPHFERPLPAGCLFCHVNRVEPVPYTINHYEAPLFRGHAIGCERCHGPGELHVKPHDRTRELDYTIVNPRHLTPALRDAVCEQCHLQGEGRIIRVGRKPFDYRPGLPFNLFWSVFVTPDGVPGYLDSASALEQMRASRCFSQS